MENFSVTSPISIIDKESLREFIVDKGFYPFRINIGGIDTYAYEVDNKGIWFGTKSPSEGTVKFFKEYLK